MVIAIEMQGVGGGVTGIENLEIGYFPTNLEACVQIPLCDIAFKFRSVRHQPTAGQLKRMVRPIRV